MSELICNVFPSAISRVFSFTNQSKIDYEIHEVFFEDIICCMRLKVLLSMKVVESIWLHCFVYKLCLKIVFHQRKYLLKRLCLLWWKYIFLTMCKLLWPHVFLISGCARHVYYHFQFLMKQLGAQTHDGWLV